MANPTKAPRRQGIAASTNTNAITPISENPKVFSTANSATRSRTDWAMAFAIKKQNHEKPGGGHALGHQGNVESGYRAILLRRSCR